MEMELRKCIRECISSVSEDVEIGCMDWTTAWGSKYLLRAWVEGAKVYVDVVSETTYYVSGIGLGMC